MIHTLTCPICKEASDCTYWKVEYSTALEWLVLVCPECGDGMLFGWADQSPSALVVSTAD
jgi:hypothetical protein